MDFFQRYKRLVILLAFFAFSLLLGFLIYSTFFKQQVILDPNQPGQNGNNSAGLPQAGSSSPIRGSDNSGSGHLNTQPPTDGRITTESPAIGPDAVANGSITKVQTISQTPSVGLNLMPGSGSIRTYNPTDGKFYRSDGNGQSTPLSDKAFYKVQHVEWSPTNNKAILTYPEGPKIIYDFDTKTQVTLPEHWKDFSFSPDGKQIVMKTMANDINNRWLAIVAADGNKVYPIKRLADDASVIPAWSPNKQIVALYTENIGLNEQSLYFVGLNDENFKSARIQGRDFRPLWSPKGESLIYSTYSDSSDLKPTMYVVTAQGDRIGDNTRKLELDTWSDKCTFGNDTTLYCAVPKQLQRGAGLFPKMAENIADDIYKVDIKTGTKTKVATPDQDMTIVEMAVSPDGSNLYFNDRTTGQLHKIKLK
jgi:Tol biopolymer transport system component